MKKKLTLILLVIYCLTNFLMVYAEEPTEVLSKEYYTNDKINYKFKLPKDWSVSEQINSGIYGILAISKDNNSRFIYLYMEDDSPFFTEDSIRKILFKNNPTYEVLSIDYVIINNKEIPLYGYTLINADKSKTYNYNIVYKDKKGFNIITIISNEQMWLKNKDIFKECILSFRSKNFKAIDLDNVDKNLNIKTIKDLLNYYNTKMNTLDTPMGKWQFKFDIMENDDVTMPYDFWIQTDWIGSKVSPYDIEYSIKYTEEQKVETRRLLREFQMKVAEIAMYYFPDKKIEGGFYWGYYKYPTLKLDYQSIKFLSWENYKIDEEKIFSTVGLYHKTKLDVFRWTPRHDDYDFTE